MTFNRRTSFKVAAALLGVAAAALGFWATQIEVPQIGETMAGGYVTGAREIDAALKQQGVLGAWAAVVAGLAAIAGALA